MVYLIFFSDIRNKEKILQTKLYLKAGTCVALDTSCFNAINALGEKIEIRDYSIIDLIREHLKTNFPDMNHWIHCAFVESVPDGITIEPKK